MCQHLNYLHNSIQASKILSTIELKNVLVERISLEKELKNGKNKNYMFWSLLNGKHIGFNNYRATSRDI